MKHLNFRNIKKKLFNLVCIPISFYLFLFSGFHPIFDLACEVLSEDSLILVKESWLFRICSKNPTLPTIQEIQYHFSSTNSFLFYIIAHTYLY